VPAQQVALRPETPPAARSLYRQHLAALRVEADAVSEYQGGPERRPRSRIAAAHDGSHVIAASVETVDGPITIGEHAAIGVRTQPGAAGGIGGPYREGAEGGRLS